MSPDELREAHVAMRDRLVAAGLFVPSGVDGLYGRSAAPVEPAEALRAPFAEGLHHHLGVAGGGEAAASGAELLAQFDGG